MANSNNSGNREHETSVQRWGTLEELLLACAVNRHGTEKWDTVAKELENKTPTLSSTTTTIPNNHDNNNSNLTFSQLCFNKFNDLKRRFSLQYDTPAGLVDHLREIRVQELRCDLQRRDVSILSLEMKVKRLNEERERSLKEEETDPLRVAGDGGGDRDGGGDDRRSLNESNSKSQQQRAETTTVKDKNDNVDLKTEPDPVRDDYDYKNNIINNNKNDNGDKVEIENDDNKGIKTRAKRCRKGRAGAGSSSCGEEPESGGGGSGGGEEVCPTNTKKREVLGPRAVKSEPLIKVLGIIRSHRLGSIFERRLRSQESERYKNLIRRHMDLQTVQSRLDKGVYSNCIQKFFRDLLLIFNNAIIFFGKKTQENLAAYELRDVVWKEMTETLGTPKPQVVTGKVESKSKPNKSYTHKIVCGTRSSMKAISLNAREKGEKQDSEVEEKPKVNGKKIEDSFSRIEDKGIRKNRTNERSVSGRKNSRTSNGNGVINHQYGGNELSSHDGLDLKMDGKLHFGRKRQGAATFLRRMKQNSPRESMDDDDDDEEEEEEEEDSSSEDESKDRKGKEKKRRGGREIVTRSSRGRGSREENAKVKRGRPSKRQAASTPEPAGGRRKRGRDNVDSEVGIEGLGRGRPKRARS